MTEVKLTEKPNLKKSVAAAGVEELLRRIDTRNFLVAIMGMGYVGIPLAISATRAGFKVLGFDVDPVRVETINSGKSGIRHVPDAAIGSATQNQQLSATSDFSRLSEPDAILIAVPTPLTPHREPDLSFVESSANAIAKSLRRGQLISLESTTWPGTTSELLKPLLEQGGLRSGRDFFLAFSPEREDPGNDSYINSAIPKVVGADDPNSMKLACRLYDALAARTVPVSSCSTAEAAKLTENIFRSVNIALVNELKLILTRMNIDVWEVIEAAATKPFGYMPFYPGPGLGGHCIPVDPFYLSWKARAYELNTHFIELAGQINAMMPQYVLDRLLNGLDMYSGRGLNGARILLIGLAYKKNVDDMRESPSLKLIDLMEKRGATVEYYDPYIPIIPESRSFFRLAGRRSVKLSPEEISSFDAIVIATDHDGINWSDISEYSRLIIDTRNIIERRGLATCNLIKA